MDKSGSKCIVQFILLDENDVCTKQKILSVFRQKHQVVHDHYSFESLKTTESSTVVQLSKICSLENRGNLVLHASWSPTSTMSIDRLPNASSTDISRSLPWIASGIMELAERKVWLNDGISILTSCSFFPRKLTILFSLFSSTNLCLPHLSSLYPNLNRYCDT